ncbi:MAG: CDP-diacylglycerol--serine O-phosphatidyltransferase [Ignavibacteriaceae bacterium]|jgi:CDP-diacylglycerol--serine O-phosphatidyltransferase|nr:CDP-diacylglycerol--serine O-phosphatidyltransferase [Ignavibacteriaceae bacterium]MCU0364628.1 CDP-diacylglycerol--serine O-phosphatidyltransferase [Ignavibacteriaceae bacterium]MCU0406953.1 CDP-diacylglycerol--serine O-phosphatidyltransferase [Ignavibacteriaceae bacterium]MCU0412993.1 CDP-diacylglycerol--serine O-phosphatidyltransferase [Ignavibacteriaceae bacterium]
MNRPRLTPSIIPNLFTAINMFCGFLSILSASEGNFNYAAWLIFIAAIFDALDGMVARLTNSSSELGVELDSLSDIVSFGAAPSFLLYKTYFYSIGTWGIIISALPLIAGGFRLARFNIQLVGFSKSFFLGLPIPSSALTIASFVLAFYKDEFLKPISDFITPLILVLSFLMVSNIRYETLPKISIKSLKEKPYHFIFLIIAVILVATMYTKGLFLAFVFMIVIGIFRHLFKLITSPSGN